MENSLFDYNGTIKWGNLLVERKNVFDYNGNMKKGEIFVENSFLSITIAIQS